MRIRSLVALSLLGVSGPAFAATDIMGYDANGDGTLTRAEFQGLQIDSFKTLDSNGNGSVTVEELQSLPAAQGRTLSGKRIMSRDTNGDGAVTEAEFLTVAPGFEKADANHDGVLAGKELTRITKFLAKAGY